MPDHIAMILVRHGNRWRQTDDRRTQALPQRQLCLSSEAARFCPRSHVPQPRCLVLRPCGEVPPSGAPATVFHHPIWNPTQNGLYEIYQSAACTSARGPGRVPIHIRPIQTERPATESPLDGQSVRATARYSFRYTDNPASPAGPPVGYVAKGGDHGKTRGRAGATAGPKVPEAVRKRGADLSLGANTTG